MNQVRGRSYKWDSNQRSAQNEWLQIPFLLVDTQFYIPLKTFKTVSVVKKYGKCVVVRIKGNSSSSGWGILSARRVFRHWPLWAEPCHCHNKRVPVCVHSLRFPDAWTSLVHKARIGYFFFPGRTCADNSSCSSWEKKYALDQHMSWPRDVSGTIVICSIVVKRNLIQ